MPDLCIERVVVTGGRHFADRARIRQDLHALMSLGLTSVATGDARGADDLARVAAAEVREEMEAWHLHLPLFAADWKGDGRSAGTRRNVRMLESQRPDLVLAYPDEGSRGTWHCVKEACKRGMTVAVWAPFVEVYQFQGEDKGSPAGIYVDGPDGRILRIDYSRRESHGRAKDGGWASLDLTEGEGRFLISSCNDVERASALLEVLDA